MSQASIANQLEQGMLHRIRSWRDVFPWLAITDALRPATSIAGILLISLATALSLGLETLFGAFLPGNSPASLELAERDESVSRQSPAIVITPTIQTHPSGWKQWLYAPLAISIDAAALLYGPFWRLLNETTPETPVLHRILHAVHQMLNLCIWAIPAGFVMRQSGLSIGGRLLRGTLDTLRLIATRFLAYLGIVFIPGMIGICIVGYYSLVAISYRIPAVGSAIGATLDVIGIPVALMGGLLGCSGLLAIPLGWAAVSLEREGSSFDGISRGYEYTLRRPLQSIGYLLIAATVLYLLIALAQAVTFFAVMLITNAVVILPVGSQPGRLSVEIIQHVPLVMALIVGYCLVAWLYLLLRLSANHQEMEDLWEQPMPIPTPLPQLDLPQQSSK